MKPQSTGGPTLPDAEQATHQAPSPRRSEFAQLIDGARAGDERAAALIVERYGKHVRRTVRRMLPSRLRSQYDSEDFGQAVWKSFFAGSSLQDQFDDPAQLIAYLAALARNKVIDESRRRLRAQKHDLNRVQGVAWDSAVAPVDHRHPSPSDVAMAEEAMARLTESATGGSRAILQLRLAGCSSREIAAITGLHERAVRRAITRLATTVEQ